MYTYWGMKQIFAISLLIFSFSAHAQNQNSPLWLENLSEEKLEQSLKEAGKRPIYIGLNRANGGKLNASERAETSKDVKTQAADYRNYQYIEPVLKQDRTNRINRYTVTDPRNGNSFEVEVKYNPERAWQDRPSNLFDKTAMDDFVNKMNENNPSRMERFDQNVRSFSIEAAGFYYGLGLHSVLNLLTEAEENPQALSQFRQMLTDPVSFASFMAFVAANRATHAGLSSFLLRIAEGRISQAQIRTLNQLVLPQIGMAAGGIASNIVHDIATLIGGCGERWKKDLLNKKEVSPEVIKYCDETYEYLLSSDKYYEYVTAVSSLLVSNVALMTGTFVAANSIRAVGGKLNLRSMAIPLKYRMAFTRLPMAYLLFTPGVGKVANLLGHWTKQAINLVLFFEVDEEIVYPYFQHRVQKNMDSGPSMKKHRAEILSRLKQAEFKTYSYEQMPQNLLDQITSLSDAESKPNQGISPMANQPGANIDVFQLGQPELVKKGFFHRLFTSGLIHSDPDAKYNLNHVKSIEFNTLLEGYYKHSKKWRDTIIQEFQTKYYNWLGMVGSFNSAVQTSYDFYSSYFELARDLEQGTANYGVLNQKHPLQHEMYMDALRMADTNGNTLADASALNLLSKEKLRMNSLMHAYCAIKDLKESLDTSYSNSVMHSRINFAFAMNEGYQAKRHVDASIRQLAFLKPFVECKAQDEYKLGSTGANIIKQPQISQKNKSLVREALTHLHYARLQAAEIRDEQITNKFANVAELLVGEMNLLAIMGGKAVSFMPLDAGEEFLQHFNQEMYRLDPEYAKVFGGLPGHYVLKQMACADSQEANILHNTWMGTIKFQLPRLTNSKPKDLCDNAYVAQNIEPIKYAQEKLAHNMGLSNIVKFTLQDMRAELSGFDQVSLDHYWLENIENQVDSKFADLNLEFQHNVDNYLVPKLLPNENVPQDIQDSFSEIPENLFTAYKNSITTYFAILEPYYFSLRQQNQYAVEAHLWMQLREEYIAAIKDMLQKFTARGEKLSQPDTGLDAETYAQKIAEATEASNIEVAESYGRVMALYKKLKTLFIYPDNKLKQETMFNPNDSEELTQYKDDLAYMRQKIWPDDPELLRYEYVNLLERRLATDKYVDQAYRENISEIANHYMPLSPTLYNKDFVGDGIVTIRQVLNQLLQVSEDAYKIAEMVNIASKTLYKSADVEKGQEKHKGSSIAK